MDKNTRELNPIGKAQLLVNVRNDYLIEPRSIGLSMVVQTATWSKKYRS